MRDRVDPSYATPCPQRSPSRSPPPGSDQIAGIGVPEVPEFLDQIVASGGHLWACRMSADMMRLTRDDLYDGVEDIINASDFIEKTDGAPLLFI
ncbi:peroxiredoxin family protein [Actinoplanes octamycinicus]|uniref:Peroxiredoxin family protein n=1 Tax=Actinoplanes octamycinicus TaxID=135948 RepID=A0A7W7H2U5_9ACTN|nr:peroxiredoxin family protein [Actinoplanes octamycinicus]GIE58361.1 hypothetical protein Aoc01nite_37630 [Actinoplanes octamycinicus]